MWSLLYRIHGVDVLRICQTYPLFLAGNKGLKARRHSETQLVYEWRLVLGMDLNLDPRFE